MFKTFYNQFIINRLTLFFSLCFYLFFIFLFTTNTTVNSERILLFTQWFKYLTTFLFIIPSLYITVRNKNLFKTSYNQLINQNLIINSNSFLNFYIMSTLFLTIIFLLPIFIYETYTIIIINQTIDYFYFLLFLEYLKYISLLLLYICLFLFYCLSEPNPSHYISIILTNFGFFYLSLFVNDKIIKIFDNSFYYTNQSIILILSDLFLFLLFSCLALLINRYLLINEFKNYVINNTFSGINDSTLNQNLKINE